MCDGRESHKERKLHVKRDEGGKGLHDMLKELKGGHVARA